MRQFTVKTSLAYRRAFTSEQHVSFQPDCHETRPHVRLSVCSCRRASQSVAQIARISLTGSRSSMQPRAVGRFVHHYCFLCPTCEPSLKLLLKSPIETIRIYTSCEGGELMYVTTGITSTIIRQLGTTKLHTRHDFKA